MSKVQGKPLWYELSTLGDELESAQSFYQQVFGWEFVDAKMPDFDYRLAKRGEVNIAGLMANQNEGIPPNWLIYFGVESCDAAVKKMLNQGAEVLQEATNVPGTGRFAVLLDPQQAPIGILEPDSAPAASADSSPFNQKKTGYAQWHELMAGDPEAAFAFYSDLLGWSKGQAMDIGDMGIYQLFQYGGEDIGGMMGLAGGPQSCWMPYFGVDGVDKAIERVKGAGGDIAYGPVEVPGGLHAALATDPQSAAFAMLGPK